MARQPSVGSRVSPTVRPAIRIASDDERGETPASSQQARGAGPQRDSIGRDRSPSSWSSHEAGQREQHVHAETERRGQGGHDRRGRGGRRRRRPTRRTPGTRGRARSSPSRARRTATRAWRSRSPTAETRAMARYGRSRPAPVGHGEGHDEQDRAGEREPHRARVEPGAGEGLVGSAPRVAARGRRGRRPSRGCAWPTSTVAATSPTSRSGRPATRRRRGERGGGGQGLAWVRRPQRGAATASSAGLGAWAEVWPRARPTGGPTRASTTATGVLSSPHVASDLHKRVRRRFEPVLEWSPRKGN